MKTPLANGKNIDISHHDIKLSNLESDIIGDVDRWMEEEYLSGMALVGYLRNIAMSIWELNCWGEQK